ncbi:MAG: hypothetical protein KFB93_03050 [Simkaniaceae bacterium]|nr:MAG: hypothetical protein KFB93_03050 [Simkaniaceae bacterium]
MEQSRLHNEFQCRCQPGYCETMEADQPDDPRVIIDRCGCIFRKSHLEASLRAQLSTNILSWFKDGREVSRFSCANRDFIIGRTYTIADVIIDPSNRYMRIWEASLEDSECDNFATLTGREELNTRQFALIPEGLGAVLKTIYEERRGSDWEGMPWSNFIIALDELRRRYSRGEDLGADFGTLGRYEQLERETLRGWERRKNECLRERRLAFDQTGWSLIKKITFTARFIYHSAVAIIFEYGLWLLRQGNFMTPMTYQRLREPNVGDRLAILLLELNGIGYNLEETPLNTVEYRLWNYVTTR